uniref:Peptidyl-prolyl cis-trans isomerase n=1 Tax=Rhizophora mucronata TaxID=61149 RepID=A0A2P2IR95_RHIMU
MQGSFLWLIQDRIPMVHSFLSLLSRLAGWMESTSCLARSFRAWIMSMQSRAVQELTTENLERKWSLPIQVRYPKASGMRKHRISRPSCPQHQSIFCFELVICHGATGLPFCYFCIKEYGIPCITHRLEPAIVGFGRKSFWPRYVVFWLLSLI